MVWKRYARHTTRRKSLYLFVFNGFTVDRGSVKWGEFRGVRRPEPVGVAFLPDNFFMPFSQLKILNVHDLFCNREKALRIFVRKAQLPAPPSSWLAKGEKDFEF